MGTNISTQNGNKQKNQQGYHDSSYGMHNDHYGNMMRSRDESFSTSFMRSTASPDPYQRTGQPGTTENNYKQGHGPQLIRQGTFAVIESEQTQQTIS